MASIVVILLALGFIVGGGFLIKYGVEAIIAGLTILAIACGLKKD